MDSAFPTTEHYGAAQNAGLTKREFYACFIMANLGAWELSAVEGGAAQQARRAVEAADALIRELNKIEGVKNEIRVS